MFVKRRQEVLDQMIESVAIIFAADEKIRNNDCEYLYRQNSDFYYLTGFEEPESVLVLAPMLPDGEKVTLFLRERDPSKETWTGHRLGVERAVEKLGVDRAYSISKLDEMLPELLKGANGIYLNLYDQAQRNRVIDAMSTAKRFRRQGIETPDDLYDLSGLLHEKRLYKTADEIDVIKTAEKISAAGFKRAMLETRPHMMEYEVQAILESEWMRRGSRRVAFETIVASGENGCTLHYVENQKEVQSGDLILVDAGCEYGYYASDISRTWPAEGEFTKSQREVYEIVLEANKKAIAACKKGIRFDDVHMVAVRVLVEGLVRLGILHGETDQLISSDAYKPYYMHRTSHWMGLDVHDVGRYFVDGKSRELEPGMILTIEPGLYLSPDDQNIPEQYRGIGIRIEDDVLITDGEPEVLTEMIPKEIAELEDLIGKKAPILVA